MPLFTDNQKLALDMTRHLAVTANAGAGKTAVLVRRFVDLLLTTNARLSEIVAITFTEKAASELRKRITVAIEERIAQSVDSSELRRLEEIRDNLASAVIETIHSFCSQLLREYPVEGNVDAGFTVLEGIDRQLLESEALQETFENVMSERTAQPSREEFFVLVRMYGRATVERYLRELLKNREDAERLVHGALARNRPDEEILHEWKDLRMTPLISRLDAPDWRSALAGILDAAKGKTADEAKKLLGQWHDRLPLDEKLELYGRISDLCLTKKGVLEKKLSSSLNADVSLGSSVEVFAGHHAAIKKQLGHALDPGADGADRTMLQAGRIFLGLYEKCVRIYDDRKAEFGQMDFDDLQFKAIALLQQPEIRRHIASKYKYVMVDEFQDTNHSQYDILRLLLSDFKEGNLFIVGDPKQSIYGFRRADVAIFKLAADKIAGRSPGVPVVPEDHQLAGSLSSQAGGIVKLPESFRLLSTPVVFINRVFAPLMSEHAAMFDVGYEALVRGRQNDAPGTVELLLVHAAESDEEDGDKTEKGESAEAVARECRMVAQKLKLLHRSRHAIYEVAGSSEAARPFKFSDAAILLRSRLHLHEIEKALAEDRIPYIVSGGIGFYQRQEILDCCNYFKFLLNPHDDVAIAGILRSPFFSISDVDLLQASFAGKKKGFWERFCEFAQGPTGSPDTVRAVKILSKDLNAANRLPIPLLLRRIFRRTGWPGTVAGLSNGRQHRANVKKLLRIAREYEGKGQVVLFDFVERLTALIADEQKEGQASIGGQDEAVRVMTIHSAKGLEFPVVIIPFTHKKFHYDTQPFVDPLVGLGFKVKDPDNYDHEILPPMFTYLNERAAEKKEAEEKRIFYVACTRARDMLIISGRWSAKGRATSWLKWLMESLAITETDLSARLIRIPSTLKFLEAAAGEYTVREEPFELEIGIQTAVSKEEVGIETAAAGTTGVSLEEVLVEPLPGRRAGEFFSATQIKTYLECPAKYYLKYQLGLPEQYAVPYDNDEDDDPDDILRGEPEGVLTHEVLQRIDRAGMSNSEIFNIITAVIKRSTEGRGNMGEEDLAEQLFRNVKSFLSSAFAREVMTAGESMTEFTINTALGNNFLTGTIDRLYVTADGQWHIIDYKTDRLSLRELASGAQIYEPQMAFYALLVSRYYRQPAVRTSLVFLRYPDRPFHHEFGAPELAQFERLIDGTISAIKRGDFSRPGGECSHCTYRLGNDCLLEKKASVRNVSW